MIAKRIGMQWIPCTERMPDLNKPVLISARLHGREIIDIVSLKQGILKTDIYWENEEWVFSYELDEVIAWMPLPEHYKGDKMDA